MFGAGILVEPVDQTVAASIDELAGPIEGPPGDDDVTPIGAGAAPRSQRRAETSLSNTNLRAHETKRLI